MTSYFDHVYICDNIFHIESLLGKMTLDGLVCPGMMMWPGQRNMLVWRLGELLYDSGVLMSH